MSRGHCADAAISQLLAIRLGSGALTLPKDVARIHMRFAPKIDSGHRAPRYFRPARLLQASFALLIRSHISKFWRHELVRLKYHNPAVPMTVDRTAIQTDPAVMTVFFTSPNANKASTPPVSTSGDKTSSEDSPAERTEFISMTNTTPEAILEQLIRVTKAVPVPASAEDKQELEALEEARRKSQRDSKVSQARNQAKKNEEELLARARGELD